MGLVRKARQALLFRGAAWGPLARAVLELAVARLCLRAGHSTLQLSAKAARRASLVQLRSDEALLVDRVAFAISRVAQRVPWRADCLVQALAAERWLRLRGIPAQLVIGVNKDGPSPLEAHAWLRAGDRIVTGGDISGYVPLAS